MYLFFFLWLLLWLVEFVSLESVVVFVLFWSVDVFLYFFFFFSSRRRHTRSTRDWSSDVCSSDLKRILPLTRRAPEAQHFPGFTEEPPMDAEELRNQAKRWRQRVVGADEQTAERSEERRVGKEWRARR